MHTGTVNLKLIQLYVLSKVFNSPISIVYYIYIYIRSIYVYVGMDQLNKQYFFILMKGNNSIQILFANIKDKTKRLVHSLY